MNHFQISQQWFGRINEIEQSGAECWITFSTSSLYTPKMSEISTLFQSSILSKVIFFLLTLSDFLVGLNVFVLSISPPPPPPFSACKVAGSWSHGLPAAPKRYWTSKNKVNGCFGDQNPKFHVWNCRFLSVYVILYCFEVMISSSSVIFFSLDRLKSSGRDLNSSFTSKCI